MATYMADTRPATDTDAEAIQGTWVLSAVRTGQGELPPDHPDYAAKACWTFTADKLTYTFAPDPDGAGRHPAPDAVRAE
jgi:hypothetical protein